MSQQKHAFIESMPGNNYVSVNQRVLRKQFKLPLKSGDEIVIHGSKAFSYVVHIDSVIDEEVI